MKNMILKAVTSIAAILFITACLCIDSEPVLFTPGIVSGIWILLFVESNPQLFKFSEEDNYIE